MHEPPSRRCSFDPAQANVNWRGGMARRCRFGGFMPYERQHRREKRRMGKQGKKA
jgi:hypothetical protein